MDSSEGDWQKKLCFKRNVKTQFDLLPEIKLERIDSPSGRKYITPEGHSYMSVTTLLGLDRKDGIQKWRDAVGEVEANRISNRASTRGTILHENIEQYIKNEKVSFLINTELLNYELFKSIRTTIDNIDRVRLQESSLYSDVLRLAGTVDCVADYEGTPSIIDFKSSTNLKDKWEIDNYFIQTACYSIMIEERFGLKVKQLVIIIATEFSKPTTYIDDRKNWIKPLGELLKKHNVI